MAPVKKSGAGYGYGYGYGYAVASQGTRRAKREAKALLKAESKRTARANRH